MGVADLIKQFDSSNKSGNNIDITIFQPDQISALAKSGLKVNGAVPQTSPKKSGNKGVGLATASRTVVVTESGAKQNTNSAKNDLVKKEETEDNEPLQEAEEKEPVQEDAEEKEPAQEKKEAEDQESVQKEAEDQESVQKEAEDQESVQKEAEDQESVQKEAEDQESVQKEAEDKKSVAEKEPFVENKEAVEKEDAENKNETGAKDMSNSSHYNSGEAPADIPQKVADDAEESVLPEAKLKTEMNASNDSLKETLTSSSNQTVEELPVPETLNTKPENSKNLRQEQKEEKQEKEQKKIENDDESVLSSPEYLKTTENISKPSLDTRLGRDDPFTFGTRYLPENENDIWNFNSWDHFKFTQEDIDLAESKIKLQKEVTDKEKYLHENAYKHWDNFYSQHKENFFKDRKWLPIEFPILQDVVKPDYGALKILEVGCGVGNTFNCVLRDNENEKLEIHALDYSYTAIDLIRENEFYQQEHEKGIAFADRWDICDSENLPVAENSVDLIIMIFVFSALEPKQWEQTIKNCSKLLKKGGKILFRDYGRYDLAQVRFKGERLLEENFYIRGDGTRVYFFTEEEINDIFTKGDEFDKIKIGIDRRLLVNRKKKIKMYRQWVQAVFQKS